jgi:Cu/Ag efflux protein CusF
VVADANATKAEYTKGVVKKINLKSGKVTVIHEELKSLNMPAMTMVFRVADDAMLDQMNAGDNIEFLADRVNGKLMILNLK